MIQWLDNFYGDPELRSTLMESFLPAFSGYVSEAVGGPVAASFVQSLAEAYVKHHLDSSRIQLQEVIKGSDDPLAALAERFTEWEEKRPTKVARNELVRAANAAQVERMREQGVTRKVWRSSGGSCPYCTGLNGRTISIEEDFFTPDDEFTPEGAESPLTFTSKIGHPPVHQGCDCSIEAVAGDSESTETTDQQEQDAEPPHPFDNPEYRAELRRDFRPADDDPAGQKYWDEMNSVATEMDRLGFPSEWSGRFVNVPGRGHYDGASDNMIVMDVAGEGLGGSRYHNMVHEVTHGVTPGGHGGYRNGIPGGWEEGPTDMFANVFGTRIRAPLNLPDAIEESALRFGTSNSYSPYREGMERIRGLTGLDQEEFYGQMMRTPLMQRPYVVRDMLPDPSMFDQVQAISDEFLTPVI